jgi:hypothetical protein
MRREIQEMFIFCIVGGPILMAGGLCLIFLTKYFKLGLITLIVGMCFLFAGLLGHK